MMEVGRICVKLAGRDAGKKCVIVDSKDGMLVIDGETRRRKCNAKHLEPTNQVIKMGKNADHNTVVSEFKKLGIELRDTKPKKAAARPMKIRAEQRKKAAEKAEKKVKKAVKKQVVKEADNKAAVPTEKPAELTKLEEAAEEQK